MLILSGMRPDYKDTRRLYGESWDLVLGAHDGPPANPGYHVSMGVYFTKTDQLHEVVFNERGTIGSDTDRIFNELAIALSRRIQGRNPITGETL